MEILMCLLLGILSMFILLHSSVLILAAAYVLKRKPKGKAAPEEQTERDKSEEERRAELEMKLFNEGIANILSYDTRPRGERNE